MRDDELAGVSKRVKAAGLLAMPAFSPVLAGFEPYTRLVRAIRTVSADRAAVLEFAYDWRLSVRHNAGLLATAMHDHLAVWRRRSGRPNARVVLVAHSMGGLLCQHLSTIPGAMDPVHTVVTLGTPFDGAAKAAVILADGDHVRILTPSDVADLGGDRALAQTAFDDHAKRKAGDLPGHQPLIGIEQSTLASLTLDAGIATGRPYTFTLDDGELARHPKGS